MNQLPYRMTYRQYLVSLPMQTSLPCSPLWQRIREVSTKYETSKTWFLETLIAIYEWYQWKRETTEPFLLFFSFFFQKRTSFSSDLKTDKNGLLLLLPQEDWCDHTILQTGKEILEQSLSQNVCPLKAHVVVHPGFGTRSSYRPSPRLATPQVSFVGFYQYKNVPSSCSSRAGLIAVLMVVAFLCPNQRGFGNTTRVGSCIKAR